MSNSRLPFCRKNPSHLLSCSQKSYLAFSTMLFNPNCSNSLGTRSNPTSVLFFFYNYSMHNCLSESFQQCIMFSFQRKRVHLGNRRALLLSKEFKVKDYLKSASYSCSILSKGGICCIPDRIRLSLALSFPYCFLHGLLV